MSHSYIFDNATNINNDEYAITERELQNNNYNDYITSSFGTCCASALNKALQQPNVFIKAKKRSSETVPFQHDNGHSATRQEKFFHHSFW